MSSKSNDQGRAYEYICLTSLYEAIKSIRKAKIVQNSSFDAALQKLLSIMKSILNVI